MFKSPVTALGTVNDTTVAVGLENGDLIIYDIAKGENVVILPEPHSDSVSRIFVTENKIISAGKDHTVRVHSLN